MQSRRLVYESGEWEVDLARRELRARGVPVPIGGRTFEIMEVLVQSAGELVTKKDLMGRVWPGAIVEDNTLQFHISAVRKALGPDRGILKTASGRGYRLLGAWTFRQESTSSVDAIDLQPVRSAAEPFQTNLPAAASELIGRTIAVQHVRDLLSAYRVVTLTGPGGIGKTRLGLEVARLFSSFQGDVRLVELVSLSDPGLVPTAVTGVLGLKLGGDEISAESVARAIGAQKLLLVLDNCEHVINAAAKLAETVVRMCTCTTILATSREILKIEGEFVYRVPPLDVPPQHEEPGNILGHSAGGEIAASEVIRSLANLVTKSQVTLELGGVIARYRLHETTRAYALEKLAESGEFEQVARRHANYYRDLFDRAERELDTLPVPAWLTTYGHQIGEVRAALDWAFSPTGAAEIGVALTVAAVPLWVHLLLMEECRGRVEQALSGPAESRDARRNMQLYAALGAALFLTKGSCPEMLAAWTSAFEIAEILDDGDYRLRALWGLYVDCFTSGRYRAALAVAERFCAYAAKTTDPADGPIGDRLVGVALLVLGDQEGARRHIERMLGRYVARRSHIIRFHCDQRLFAHSYHSRIFWLQGFADQVMRSVECQIVDARASDHPWSLANALLLSACPIALLAGDLILAERYVKALMDLSARHAMELWNLGDRCFGGVLLVKRGDIGAGQELLRTAFARVLQNAFSMLFTPFLAEIADALGRDDKAAGAIRAQRGALVRRRVSAHQR